MELQPVPSFPNYKVDKEGNVYGSRGHKLKLTTADGGRRFVRVHLPNGKTTPAKVHRLVLEAFVGSPPPGFIACHNNGDPSDNRLSNLRWDTYKENYADMVKHGRQNKMGGETHPCAKLNKTQVLEIKRRLKNYYYGITADLAKEYKISRQQISKIRNHRRWLSL